MKQKIEFTTIIHQYDSIDELDHTDKELMILAQEVSDKAYAPYSEFFVGAALLLENGKIITGNNQENVAYPSGLCAERVAIFNAGALYPETPVKIIAITAKSKRFKVDHPIAPCGACRQVIAEYEQRHQNNIKILLMGEKGKIYEVNSIKDMLPLMFDEKGLRN